MPLDPSFIGRTYPPTEPYLVGREKIREFADAIGDGNPACRDIEAARARGHRDIVAPPTFPVVVTARASALVVGDAELGVDYSRVVHGEQRFAYTRPVYAGDELTCTVVIENIQTKAGLDFLTARTEVTADGGEAVAKVWSTLVVRGEGR